MMKKGGATCPSSQPYILAFAIWGDVGLSTIQHQATVPIFLTRGCSGLVQSLTRQG